jgi:ketosteroid isomerase-like protein
MSEKNKEIVEKLNAACAEGDMEAFLDACTEDVEWRVIGDKTLKGKDAIREFSSSMENAGMEHPKFTVEEIVAEGDTVVCYGNMTMNEKGETVPYSFCDVYRFKDEKIVRLQSFVIKNQPAGESEKTAAA